MIHTDALTLLLVAVVALAGLVMAVGNDIAERTRRTPDLPAIAMRRALEAPGSAQDRVDGDPVGDDFESEAS